ncbi:putative ribonuclease H-like domain-containing protein [Tanacetum coccineum]
MQFIPGRVLVTPGSVVVTPGSVVVTTGSVVVTPGSVVVTPGSVVVTTGSVVVTPGSVVILGSVVVTPGSVVVTTGSVVESLGQKGAIVVLNKSHGLKEETELVLNMNMSMAIFNAKGDVQRPSCLGSTSGIRACALRNFDLEDMELESTNSSPNAKLPILKLGEYEMWAIRIKQYFQIQNYALWEVIENGDSWVSVSQTTKENGITVTKMSTPVTVKE